MHKTPKNGRFPNIKFHDPLAGSPFGRGRGLRPLNFRTQVPTFRTQVETGQGKTLLTRSVSLIFAILTLSLKRQGSIPAAGGLISQSAFVNP